MVKLQPIMSTNNLWNNLGYKSQEELDARMVKAIKKKDVKFFFKVIDKYRDSNDKITIEIIKYADLIVNQPINLFKNDANILEIYYLSYLYLNYHFIKLDDYQNVMKYFMRMLKNTNMKDWDDIDYADNNDSSKLFIEEIIYDITVYLKDKDINEFSQCYDLLHKIYISYYCNDSPYIYQDEHPICYYRDNNVSLPAGPMIGWEVEMSGVKIMEKAMQTWDTIQKIRYYYKLSDFEGVEYYLKDFLNAPYNENQNLQEVYKMIEQIDENEIKTTGIKMIKQLLHKQLDLLDMHFKFAPDTNGYKEAKKHFYQTLNKK